MEPLSVEDTIQNMPFKNLLEYTEYFLKLKDNIDELKNFVIEHKNSDIDCFEFFLCVNLFSFHKIIITHLFIRVLIIKFNYYNYCDWRIYGYFRKI